MREVWTVRVKTASVISGIMPQLLDHPASRCQKPALAAELDQALSCQNTIGLQNDLLSDLVRIQVLRFLPASDSGGPPSKPL